MINDEQQTKMLKDMQRKKAFSSDVGAYIPHAYQVLNDPDFRKDASRLKDKVDTLYAVDGWNATEEAENAALEAATSLVREVADKYKISINDLTLYADGLFDRGADYGQEDSDYGGFTVHHDSEESIFTSFQDSKLCYVIGPKTTLNQIKRDWPTIKLIQTTLHAKKRTKIKSPDEPVLIYAIFKALTKEKLKFSRIFLLYQHGELKGYEAKPTNQFNSADSLARYYRKYMPKEQVDNPYVSVSLPKYVRL